jgi:hypothetical protein
MPSNEDSACHPLTLTRRIEDFPIGNIPLSVHQKLKKVGPCEVLTIHPQAWLDVEDAAEFTDLDLLTIVDEQGVALAWRGDHPDLARAKVATKSFVIRHPWDLLRANEQFVSSLTDSSLSHGTANHPEVVKRLIEVAEKISLPIQHEASSRFTGTDTDKIFHSRDGVPSALVSLPLRCMHSVVETAHLRDVEQTIQLLTGFVLSLTEDDTFHQSL